MSEALIPYIHHGEQQALFRPLSVARWKTAAHAPLPIPERQEQGSMLCAQHCLNALLQREVFDAAQLAQLATQLDALEAAQLSDGEFAQRRRADRGALNHDDTGFFSVGVVEAALQAWSLRMVRWGAAELAAQRAEPERTQLAFVLNFESHWFAIRSFGARARIWYNLNSFFKAPQFVGPMYLAELLSQSQKEGYSVFAIRPAEDSAGEQSFWLSEADLIADTIPPEVNGGANSGSLPSGSGAGSASAGAGFGGFGAFGSGAEEEDAELAAAIKASLEESHQPSSSSSSSSAPAAGSSARRNGASGSAGSLSTSPYPYPSTSTSQARSRSPRTPAGTTLPEASGARQRKARRTRGSARDEDNSDAQDRTRRGAQASSSSSSGTSGNARGNGAGRSNLSRGGSTTEAITIDDDDDEDDDEDAETSRPGRADDSDVQIIDDSFGHTRSAAAATRRSPFLHPAVRRTVQGAGEEDDDVDAVELRESSHSGIVIDDDDDDDDAALYAEEEDNDEGMDPFSIPNAPEASALIGPRQDRYYDDEDEALQAALAASMGDTSALERLQARGGSGSGSNAAHLRDAQRDPAAAAAARFEAEAFRTPPPEDVGRIARMREEARRKEQEEREKEQRRAAGIFSDKEEAEDDDDEEEDDEDDSPGAGAAQSDLASSQAEADAAVTADEMRRRRLARFGA